MANSATDDLYRYAAVPLLFWGWWPGVRFTVCEARQPSRPAASDQSIGACGLLGAVITCDEWAELRSPVQVSDQIELVDLDDSGHDRTGDGVPDRFEYVVYRRVVGEEQLTLPGLGSVGTVRVDTFIKQRTTETTGEQRLVEVSCATWYAPGIGIVRRHMDMPNGPVGTRRTQDERLVAWDLESAFALSAPALQP